MSFVLTHSGKKVDPLRPDPALICIEDIAWALSNLCRFNGHVSTFYSVCEHSLRVSHMLPQELKLHGLLHDAAEAYMGDIIRPVKIGLPEVRVIEDGLLQAIAQAFGLDHNLFDHPQVKLADDTLLVTEARDLTKGEAWWLTDPSMPAPLPERIVPLPRASAIGFFHMTFQDAREAAAACA